MSDIKKNVDHAASANSAENNTNNKGVAFSDAKGEVIHAYEQLFNDGKPMDRQLLLDISQEDESGAVVNSASSSVGMDSYSGNNTQQSLNGGESVISHSMSQSIATNNEVLQNAATEQISKNESNKHTTYVRKLGEPGVKTKINKFDLVFIKIWSFIVSIVIGIANGINKLINIIFKKKAPDKYIRAFVAFLLIILTVVLVTLPFKVQVNSETVYEIYGNSLIPVRQRIGADEQGYPVYKWGYTNKKNQMKIAPIYEEAQPFMHGAAWVRVITEEVGGGGNLVRQDYWKLIDTKGKDRGKIPQRFYYIQDGLEDGEPPIGQFTNEVKLAWIYTGSYGYIDNKGNIKIEPRYKYAENFSEGFARVREGYAEFFIDKNGKKICASYEEVKTFSHGRGAVRQNGLWGFVDAKGKLVVQPTYDNVSPFLGSYAAVRRGPNYGIIDNSGKTIVTPNQYNDLVALSPEFKALVDSIRL